ncbi:ATP-grasp domain-containing protein [Candidatus Sumerlaeota bacterium]|nr:ATP-grasp domain-containing protein [Candidatus Sumerlaeota bacterium]
MADVTVNKRITRLLIANRGEIARRIIRSAHAMGIGTVAIYADGDAGAPFVGEADQAIALKGRSSAETYLNIEKVLAAGKRTGADAVHPGYGFLAENAAFARAVQDAGMIWVGPPPEAIALMGDKLSAKNLMEQSEVPTLPAAEIKPGDDIMAAAGTIGYPVLIKASAGGGGKGMRVVESEGELEDAVSGARREAAASFGDDTIFIERWLPSCRHVEIQILGDSHGNLIHCFERECSIQRRHQKIIEEAPSPAVGPELRAKMGKAAVSAAAAVGYTSAGTVEFLLDGEDFWFIEMNTRLQVEHPVTEEITGLDLVREQLRIAQGETLGYRQEDLQITGHAIEARVYAEDPSNDFLPAPGTVVLWEPSRSMEARFESGVESGSEVSIEFDPLLAKVIVHAPTRQEAALRLARVLETTRIQGVTTNRAFLLATPREPAFLSGDTTTDFIERIAPQRRRSVGKDELVEAAIAVAMAAQGRRRDGAKVLRTIASGWRNTKMPPETICFAHGDEEITVNYRIQRSGTFAVEVADKKYDVAIHRRTGDEVELVINGQRSTTAVTSDGDRWLVHGVNGDVELVELPRFPFGGTEDVSGGIVAPMPGNVRAIHVAVGDTVEKGHLMLVLEAMKMENQITAPRAGTVAAVHVAEGDQVSNRELLIVLAEENKE